MSNPYSGQEYKHRLKEMSKKIGRRKAVDYLDAELKANGCDYIDDGWQVAIFDANKIRILHVDVKN